MKKIGILLVFSACIFLSQVPVYPQSAGDLYSADAIAGNMRYVPAGFFTQGSPVTEPGRYPDENQFIHFLSRNIAVMETPVTRQMWANLRALQPSLPADRLPDWWAWSIPMMDMTWPEAVLFANILSIQNGLAPCYFKDSRFTVLLDPSNFRTGPYFFNIAANGYRLPTEGEREYFNRAGTAGPFSIDEPNYTDETSTSCAAGALPALETVSWFCANGSSPQPVGAKSANPWNLKDVHGNISEFCWDIYGPYPSGNTIDFLGASSGYLRVIRGGASNLYASSCRSAYRYGRTTYFHHFGVGFRLVRTINPAPGPFVTVTSPAGGESWWNGSAHWITWTTSGNIDYVKIEYSTDNGSTWVPIIASTPNIGQHGWTVPNAPSATYLVRVSDAVNAAVNGTCAANFSIIPIPPPALDISRTMVDFHAASGQTVIPSQWVTIRNSSGGSLSWSASASEGWVTVTPSFGSGNGQIKIDINPAGLSPGTYQAAIEVSDPQAANSPQFIHVSLNISVSSDEPYFSAELYSPALSGGGRWIATMDFDNDGDQDVVFCEAFGGQSGQLAPNSYIFAMRNDGHGNFVDVTKEVFIGSNITICAILIPGDFNGDGREDLYVADGGGENGGEAGQDLIFIQTADGRLRNEWESRVPEIKGDFAIAGDVDGDGDIDILRNQSLLINDGSGHFTKSLGNWPPPDAGFSSLACSLLDVDKDGDLDLFFGTGGPTQPHLILLNDGTEHFTKAPAGTVPPCLFGEDGCSKNSVTADFNADGWPDIAVIVLTFSGEPYAGIQLLLNNGDGTFRDESANIPSVPGIHWWMDTGDINDDGWMDIISGNLVFLNQGNADFIEARDQLIPTLPFLPMTGLISADIDNDEDTDLLSLESWGAQKLGIYRNIRPYVTASPVPYPGAPVLAIPPDGSMAGNHSPTLVWNSVSTAIYYELEVAADEGFAFPLINYTGISPTSATVGPLENDTTYYWRVRAFNTRGVGPWSAIFHFSVSPITVVSPDGGENWPVGSTHDIVWTSKGVTGTVAIDLYKNEAFHSTIGQADAAAGSYSWAIPTGLAEGTDYKVRIHQGGISDLSDANFSTYKEGIISGHITACGTPLAGAILTGLPGEPETDSSGFYSVPVPYGWSGTAVPVHPTGGHFFEPASVAYSNVKANQTSDYKAYIGIPSREREILITLYNSTHGDSWGNKDGWKTPPLEADGFGADGTEGSWYGVGVTNHTVTNLTAAAYWIAPTPIPPEVGGLTNLMNLQFVQGFTGEIPPELGNLYNLDILVIEGNALTGPIPASFASLSKLQQLHLGGNQLSGNIPVFLASLNIGRLGLQGNQFSGAIPAELGNMTGLDTLMLDCNQLSGEIPASLANLTNMRNGCLTLAYNSLYTNNPALLSFLATKAPAAWADTQTLAPAGVQAIPTSSTSVTVNWTPIAYTADGGGYLVSYGTTSGGPYTFFGQTAAKTDSSMQVTGLAPGTTYYFAVQTQTDPVVCVAFPNTVTSPYSAEASATTLAPIIREDFVATWDSQGVYYRNSDTAGWVKMSSPATMITTGDLDGDGIDDLIGLWPTQGGIWVKYSQTGLWARLSSTAVHIAAGDMNGDGRDDLLGTWDGQGVYYRNSITGAWVKLASPATMITTGDIDDDGTDDLIGIWPSQGGVWVKYSQSGAWARLSSTARDIASGDMNGDGRDDLVATWDGQGVYYRNSMTGAWVRMASEATQVTCGDLDADGKADLIGIWPTQGGVWVKYSQTGAWALLSSTARDLSAGRMRASGTMSALAIGELPIPQGGFEPGPETGRTGPDRSDSGPGGAKFAPKAQKNMIPAESPSLRIRRIPGPGETGFKFTQERNSIPGEENAGRKKKEGK